MVSLILPYKIDKPLYPFSLKIVLLKFTKKMCITDQADMRAVIKHTYQMLYHPDQVKLGLKAVISNRASAVH